MSTYSWENSSDRLNNTNTVSVKHTISGKHNKMKDNETSYACAKQDQSYIILWY